MSSLKKYTTVSETQLRIIQTLTFVLSVFGAFFVTWNLQWVLVSLIFYYLFMVIGVGLVLHRYYSHKNFEFRNSFLKYLFLGISIIASRGSPIAWVHIHREHHAYSDTDKDPHRPDKFRLFSFRSTAIKNFRPRLVKDLLDKENRIVHEYYLLFILSWCAILFLINPVFLYFAWILPVTLTQITQDMWNYAAHTEHGYRNFNTKDNSRNVIWLWPLIFGEAWHNNHHFRPSDGKTSFKKWEFDPVYYLMKVIGK